MIINNYNKSLAEIKETDESFWEIKCPQLFVGEFDFRIPKGGTLVIPYRVYLWNDEEEKRIKNNEDPRGEKGTFVDTLGKRFTTIVTLDEDKEKPENGYITYKNTTYEGQQVIEIGPFNDPGEHCFTIQAVQENGVGTARHFFRFVVEDPEAVQITKHFEELLTDLGNGELGFTSAFTYDESMNTPDEDNSFTNNSIVYRGAKIDSKYRPAKIVTVANYKVTTKWNLDGTLKSFKIVIDKNDDCDENDVEKYNDTGFVYKTPLNNFLKVEYSVSNLKLLTYPKQKECIAGVYEFNTTCTINGEEKLLTDYLSTTFLDLPLEVLTTAVKNKIALTRLFEAFKAKCDGKTCTLIMPKNLDIVVDYHGLNENGEANLAERVWMESFYYLPNGKVPSENTIEFPDKFTWDLNGSIINVLLGYDTTFSGIIIFNTNYDSHVINGKISGMYHYYDYNELKKIRIKNSRGEYVSVGIEGSYSTAFWGSRFCSFENMDISGSVGYECYFGESKLTSTLRTTSTLFCPPFDVKGYVGFDGTAHFKCKKYNDGIPIVEKTDIELDEDGCYNGIPQLGDSYLSTYEESLGHRDIALHHTLGDITGSGNLQRRHPTHSADEFIRGHYFIPETVGIGGGNNHRHIGRELFVHFYKGPILPSTIKDSNKYEYLCTHKVLEEFPVVIPKEATHASMSAWGYLAPGGKSNNKLNTVLNNKLIGALYPEIKNNSVGCAYINCRIHNNRTSLFDNNFCNLSLVKDCITWDGGSGRSTLQGGWSNLTLYVDIEDNANYNCEVYFTRLENLYGATDFKMHFSKNINFKDTCGFVIGCHKGTFGEFIDGHLGDSIIIYHGFASPRKYATVLNVSVLRLDNEWEHTRGNAKKDLNVRNSVIGYIGDSDEMVFLKDCKREGTYY